MAPSEHSGLSIGAWNPMNLTRTYRAEEISKQFSSLHILGLVGTQCREHTDVGHTQQDVGRHRMIHFGFDDGRHTNKSAGCAVYFREPLRMQHVADIKAPPADSGLRGRAGSVTFICREIRVKIITAYFQPQPWKTGERSAVATRRWHQSTDALMNWITAEWNATPHRVIPLIVTDLNSSLGSADESSVGHEGGGRPNYNGDRMRTWMTEHCASALNTFFRTGPTFVGKFGPRKIDFVIGPTTMLRSVIRCSMLGKKQKASRPPLIVLTIFAWG